jgi:Mg-chelatase subunit ChlD
LQTRQIDNASTAKTASAYEGFYTQRGSDGNVTPMDKSDPDWFGLLEHPEAAPGPDNHFVSRNAYSAPSVGFLGQVQETNAISLKGVPEEMIAPGMINFEAVDMSQALDIYAKLVNRILLRSALPNAKINLNTGPSQLTKTEAIQALQAALALNGVSAINIGDKFVKAVPSSAAAELDRTGSTNTQAPGSYVTRVIKLKFVKPSEMVPVIQPFSHLTNSILPNDDSGILVLRDTPENVLRIQEMINQVDVSVPAEYVSEVIPIRYAKVDDIASALNGLAGGQVKIIPDETGSTLLIYATRPDMEVLLGAIGKLDKEKQADLPLRKPAPNAPVPQPEILTRANAFSTFSLNVSDASFKLAEASLQNNKLPDTASIRSEEFINAFDYRDPEAAEGQPMAFTSERARYRFAIKTAAAGRQEGRALNLVLLLDNSGSMERADRVEIIREALRVLATQLQPQDIVSVVTFSRTARLWADGISGDKAGETLDQVGNITPEGGTNLEEAMRLAYLTARRHYLPKGMNRVVLLTDGAANLGDVDPNALKQKVEVQRKQGIALDCFGIGWEDYNDDLLEQLSSNGDGRYAFLNSPEDTTKDFAAKLAGALQIAAADVKVQVEFNPARVISYRQIGYATHQLTKEQFRDNTVAAGQMAAQEAGNALYTVEINPDGDGPVATVHVRYQVPGTDEYREHSWDVAYTGSAPALEQTSPAMRLAATASAFSEWLAASPYAQEVTLDELLKYLSGVPEVYGPDDRPEQLETMIREARSLAGNEAGNPQTNVGTPVSQPAQF